MINPWYGEEEAWHASDVLSLEEGFRGLEPDQMRELKPLREEN